MKNCKTAALAASIALALGTTAAFAAAPTATQLPGQGVVVSTGTAPGVGTIASGAQTITLNSNTVIDWGVSSGATINTGTTAQPGGFNVGSSAALTFNDAGNSVLNVDVSGNPSQIMGALNNTGAGNIYVANANGVIVGAGAVINAGGEVGLVGNTLGDVTAFDAAGTMAAVGYNGTGGDVTVAAGADVSGATVLVSGGGAVNVDLGSLTGGDVTLMAGTPNNGGAFASSNANATLVASGSLGGATLVQVFSAGDATNNGTVDTSTLTAGDVAGVLTNNGTLTLASGFLISGALVNNKTVNQTGAAEADGGVTNAGAWDGGNNHLVAGGLTNNGKMDNMAGIESDGDFTNNGQIANDGEIDVEGGNFVNGGAITGVGNPATSFGGVTVVDGDFTNSGSMVLGDITHGAHSISVTNGSIVNNGAISGADDIETYSDASDPSFTAGGDYSITNAGTITSPDSMYFDANDQYNQADATGTFGNANGSTGSFTNTGTLQVAPESLPFPDNGIWIEANNDIAFGGVVQTNDGAGSVKALSAANPLAWFGLEAGNYEYNSAFTNDGTATLTTDVTTDGANYNDTFIAGNQVKLMANLSSVDTTGTPAGYIGVVAGAQQASDYAVRVAAGKTITADQIGVGGDQAGDNPNVILQGTLAANHMWLGNWGYSVSDVFTGPAGGLEMWNDGSDPYLYINATGRVKTAPYLNDANFRYNFLPVTIDDGSQLSLEIDPSNMTGVPVSGLNLLVNSDVMLSSDMSATVTAGDSAVTGVTNIPNSHLVLQSTGSIETGNGGDFYWPGYIYLGNIAADADGNAQPGTLGLGKITTDGEFNNVLPGDVAGASGIHFITQFPLTLGGDVVTNANAWVNFGTQLLTDAYASGSLAGDFFGGVQGSGTVVNYGPLDSANFHFQAPNATK